MRKARETYLNILNVIKKNNQEIEYLKNKEEVKRYLELLQTNLDLEPIRKNAYKEMKLDEYSKCNHIWIIISTKPEYYGCIKCGLDHRVYNYSNQKELSFDEQIMYEYLDEYISFDGTFTDICCDIDLATTIFQRIKERNPHINDKLALKYFEIALDNIRNIPVNEQRKLSRIKRLSLNPKFTKWNKSDI